jgi:hypothetical protein
MRSVTSAALAIAAVAMAGCGDYSTEDLRFLVALPQRQDLRVEVPADGTPGAATVCGPGRNADVWLWAKPTSDGLNRGVEFVISLVDVVRGIPPTAREEDARRWGPFPDERHPGHEIQVVIARSYPSGSSGPPLHDYRFEARAVGAPTFEPVIVGTFEGASSSHGRGAVRLDFDAIRRAGIADATTPTGAMEIGYDRASDPVTISLTFTREAFGIEQFGYGFTGYADGRGAFDYRFRNATGDVLTVATGYDRAGAGRAAVAYDPANPLGPPGSFRQCWSASACLTYVDDPANFTCPLHASCSFGTFPADCPEVPVSPF